MRPSGNQSLRLLEFGELLFWNSLLLNLFWLFYVFAFVFFTWKIKKLAWLLIMLSWSTWLLPFYINVGNIFLKIINEIRFPIGMNTAWLMTWWLMQSRVKEDMSGHARTMMVMCRVTSWLKVRLKQIIKLKITATDLFFFFYYCVTA